MGSITKTFTATMILKLAEENRITLDQKIAGWFPQYPRWKNITVDNLLKHASGVSNYTHGENFDRMLRENPGKYFPMAELADLAYSQTDVSKPAEKYHYTNTDYVLLGMIIEKVTHQTIQQMFDEYLRQYHLNHTFYTPSGYPGQIKDSIAHGYNRDGTFKFNEDVTFVSMSFTQSAGALVSTPEDIIHWLNDLFSGKILTNGSLAKMMTVMSEINLKPIDLKNLKISNKVKQTPFTEIGSGAGIGLLYFKDYGFVWVHAGGTLGYESFYVYNPCNGIYLVLTYSTKLKQQLVFTKIASDIFEVLNNSSLVKARVQRYQQNHLLPLGARAVGPPCGRAVRAPVS